LSEERKSKEKKKKAASEWMTRRNITKKNRKNPIDLALEMEKRRSRGGGIEVRENAGGERRGVVMVSGYGDKK